MSKGKKEKKHRKSSLTDEQKKEVKAYLRSIRAGYKAGLPVTVTVGKSTISAVAEDGGTEGKDDSAEDEEKPKAKKSKKVVDEDADGDGDAGDGDGDDKDEDDDE